MALNKPKIVFDAHRSERACDRCHAIKERCRWICGPGPCERCSRLNHNCDTRRPLQKAGRKSRHASLNLNPQRAKGLSRLPLETLAVNICRTDADLSSTSTRSSPATSVYLSDRPQDESPRLLPLFGNLDEVEQHLLQLCLGTQTSVGQFTLGPSFHERHQRAFVTHFGAAMPQLKDAFLSSAAVLANYQDVHLPEALQKLCHKRAATAVSSLRSLKVSGRQDVSVCLILGVVLTTFALYVAGGEVYTLCRFTLSLVKPTYESTRNFDSDEISFLVCLVFTEAVECLFSGDIPTLRFKPEDTVDVVDRYLGLSSPLLPYLYDLCGLNHALRHTQELGLPRIMERLNLLEQAVLRWNPTPPADFLDRFRQAEVINMLAQAKILRLTILLIIHRLRHPFDTKTGEARIMSDAIMKELELAMRLTNQPLKCAHISSMTACLELEDEQEIEVAIESISHLMKYSRQFQSKIRTRLARLWEAKEYGASIYWFNLSDLWPTLSPGCVSMR